MSYPSDLNANTEPCDACGSPSCPDLHLCDVSWDNFQPVEAATPNVAAAEIAEAWGSGSTLVIDRDQIGAAAMAVADGKGAYAGHAELAEMMRSGATFADVAHHVGMPLVDVVRKFTQIPQDRLADVLKAESLLRSGTASYAAVERETGLARKNVQRLASIIGLASTAAANRQGGGGTKYTAEQIAQAWAMRDDGRSYREIAEAMPEVLKDTNAAVGLIRRNARPSDSGRGDGTVAA